MYKFFYTLIGIIFRLGLLPFFRVTIEGTENYSESPSSMIVTNHKRDLDSILVASVFYFRNGYLRPGEQIAFMGDENLFQPGFLGDWLDKSRVLKNALKSVSVGSILKKLGAYPIGKLEFNSLPVYEVLKIIESENGSCPLAEVLEKRTSKSLTKSFSKALSEPTIADYFKQQGYPRKTLTLREIKKPYRKLIKQKKVEEVKKQLRTFVKLLDEEGILYITPEGRLSEDGALGSLRDSLHILVEDTESGITVVPTNVTYDFMTSNKPTIFVRIGSEIRGLSNLDRKARTERIRKAILGLTTVTMGQLGSRQLVKSARENRFQVSAEKLRSQAWRDLAKLTDRGVMVDKRLKDPQQAIKRWEGFRNYCINKEILQVDQSSQNLLIIDPQLGFNRREIDRGYRKDPVRYSANELEALEEAGLVSF